MPYCFLPFLERLRKQEALVTRAEDIELEGEHNNLLPTRFPDSQNEVHYPKDLFSFTHVEQHQKPSKDRFISTSDGHRHYLRPPELKRRFRRSSLIPGLEGLRRKNRKLSSLQAEWEKWTEGNSGGWHIESHMMVVITQKYGEIENVAGFGTNTLVLLSHKVQDWGPNLDRYYALKIFRRRPEQTELDYNRCVYSEYSIASSLRHQNIIEIFELLPLGNGNLCACMEYCSGGDLHSLIVASRRLLEGEADCFMKQLMGGILYLHDMGIAHRDLKPENLLLTSHGRLKISDFGNAECFRLAWEVQIHMSIRRCGSVPYISPEQYLAHPFDPRQVDIWAAALVYIAMRAGRLPWKSATDKDECFRDYVEDCRAGSQYFLIKDVTHVRLSLSFRRLAG
jgi:hypothetical protein